MIRLLCILVGILLISDCTTNIAGGTTDTGNSKVASVAGIASYEDGSFAANARVTLRPKNYLAANISVSGISRFDAFTNARGMFALDSIDTGEYFLEINDRKGYASGIILTLNHDTNSINTKLLPVATIRGIVKIQGTSQAPVAIQIRGLERYIQVDTATDSFTISDVPSGSYILRVNPSATTFPSTEINVPFVAPGSVTQMQPIILSAFLQEDYSSWKNQRRIMINTTVSGANVDESVTSFPVLIRLDSNALNFSDAQPNGADIRFGKNDGTKLRYEIEQWDGVRKTASIWVLCDTIRALDTTGIIMYWGNSTAYDYSNGPAVFDTANGFAGVWHMNVDNGLIRDATAYENHGTPVKFDGNEVVAGCIGKALSADQTGNHVIVADKPELRLSRNLTISLWTNGRAYGRLLCKRIYGGKNDYELYYHASNYSPEMTIGIDSAESFYSSGSGTPNNAAWNYLAATYDGNQFSFIMNESYSIFGMNWNGPITTTTSPIAFFATPEGNEPLALPLDEIRIEQRVRSKGWLTLCYENQRPDQKLVQFR